MVDFTLMTSDNRRGKPVANQGIDSRYYGMILQANVHVSIMYLVYPS